MSEDINWDEATASADFIELKPDVEKILVLTDAKLERRPKDSAIAPNEVEFIAEVIEEDGKDMSDSEKKFTTTSKRLKTKLRPIFEKKESTDKVKLSILRVGEQYNTQYSVKEITD